ncbi:MAG: molybdenum cofactor guanylyltransferase [Planctomycetota bacterium]
MSTPATGLVLVGGAGRRMGGGCKALIELAGRSLIDWVRDAIAPLVEEVLIVGAGPQELDRRGRRVLDQRPGLGPLAGLEAGLSAATTPAILTVACDMPQLSPRLLSFQLSVFEGASVVLRRQGRAEPLHAVYPRELLPEISKRLDEGDLSLRGLIEGIPVRWVDEDEADRFDPARHSSRNVNTREDLEKVALELAKDGGNRGPR